MIFKRFEPLTKEERKGFIARIPREVALTVIFSSIPIYVSISIIIQSPPTKTPDFIVALIVVPVFAFAALAFPYMLVQSLVDIHNNQKKIFIFELTKKEIKTDNKNDYCLFFHHKRKFKLNKAIQYMEKFYHEIAVGDIIELHQLPKSEEFIHIQKISR